LEIAAALEGYVARRNSGLADKPQGASKCACKSRVCKCMIDQ